MSRTQRIILVVLFPLVIVGGYFAGQMLGAEETSKSIQISSADDSQTFEHDYYIPEGAASRINAGEDLEIVPAELEVNVGDAIRIINDDVEDHVVGVFFVAAGETLTQRFNTVGVLEGECSVHPSGQFTLRVTE